MNIYLDTNVFYNAFSPVEEADRADYVLEHLSRRIFGVTSEWTIAEMFRAYKKQVNLGVIDTATANIAIDFFVAEINKMVVEEKLQLVPVKSNLIYSTRTKIFENNLYAADAIHVASIHII